MQAAKQFLYCSFLLCLLNQAHSQELRIKKIGTPFINTYLPEAYGAHEQTYTVVQSNEGMLYFANVTGIIEFDGQTWQVDERVSEDAFKDVALGPQGRIYGASKGELGYFAPNELGQLVFISLLPKIPSTFENNGTINSVDLVGDDLIFGTSKELLIYHPDRDTVSIISSPNILGQSDVVDGEYYIMDSEDGLLKLSGNTLNQLPLGKEIKDLGVISMTRFRDEELLLVTRTKGIFVYDFQSLREWDTEVSKRLKESFGYVGLNIQDNYYAFGTDNAGVLIINKEGELVQKIDKTTGLPDYQVYDLVMDASHNLWITQHGAINQVILNSPITTLDERHGVNGYVLYMSEYQGDYYVSTTTGMAFKPKERPWQSVNEHRVFTSIENYPHRTWMFFKKSGDLLAASNTGLLQVDRTSLEEIYKGERLWAGAEVPGQDQMLIGSVEGHLHFFEKQNGKWKYLHQLKGFEQQMDFLEWDESGDFWMTDSGSGVFRLTLNEAKDEVLSIKSYGRKDGLPDSIRNRVFRHSDGLKFATDNGVYTFDPQTETFSQIPEFNQAESYYVFRFAELANGNIYGSINGLGKGLFRKNGNNYNLELNPYQRIESHNSEYATSLGTDDVWITSSGIKHIDTDYETIPTSNFKAKIREVRIATNIDSVVFGGATKELKTLLSPKQNALNISFSASFYDELETLEFQTFLEGGEDEWSNWSAETDRTFTNLPHGSYTFKVRGRNLYGELSEIDEFSFEISTPWYLTVGAFVIYITLLAGGIWLIVKVNSRKLIAQKEKLEKLVEERTAEIRMQKDAAEKDKKLIKAQADKLRELDKVKSRFFANISHELRTPLTLINAPLESLMADENIKDSVVRSTLEVAQNNGKRLLSLVEEILDLAKLEAGKLKLVENPVRIKEFVDELFAAYSVKAENKSIQLELIANINNDLAILCDERKCAKVLNNLLSNALKFTPSNGKITVVISELDQLLEITVTDNGHGIHPDDLPRVFDRFYQSEQPGKKAEGGTGIGLALAKELAILLGGDLTAESRLGEMTKFTFTFELKRITEQVLVPLTQAQSEQVEETLTQTIERYSKHFQVDKPVLLITEDHPEMRAFVSKTLEPYFQIMEAENGRKALDILSEKSVDIIISDVMMPVMDGFELLEQIKMNDHLKEVSIVMLTARADSEDKLQALTMGIDDYLTKPFSAAEFLARIKNILENRIKILRRLKKEENTSENGQANQFTQLIEQYELTEREVEILELLGKRYSNQEIADALFVSTNTVKYHLKNLYQKLGISNRSEITSVLE